jgi:C-terminal processing protease CtpA/Prc
MPPRRAKPRLLMMLLAASALGGPACSDHPAKTLQAYPDQLVGIGAVVQTSAEGHVVDRLIPGGPAAAAGLKAGDRIVAVNGDPTDGKTLATVVDSLRGKDGTPVVLTVSNAGGTASVTIVRRPLARANGGEYQPK